MEESKFLVELDLNNLDLKIDYKTSSKFSEDKIYIDNNKYLLIFDGITLNKKELLEQELKEDLTWEDYVLREVLKNEKTFFNQIKGSYHGIVYNKENKELICFSDHISSKPLFYYFDENIFLVSKSCVEIIDGLKQKNIEVKLNEVGAYFLLSYGFPIEDLTVINEVKRVLPGHYLNLNKKKVSIEQFFKLTNENLLEDQTDAEIIENLDKLFRRAVARQFDKDKEYGYEHLVALSGGLDSRMTSWVAHDMGYINQLNFTFSQSDYLDETIPKKIASDLKHEWIFSFLDNGLFLKDVDKITNISGGNVLYYGLAHGNRMLEKLNICNYGIIHSGQLGDVIIGTYNETKKQNETFKIGDGAYSKTYLNKIKNYKPIVNYVNQEIFKLNTRGFVGTNYGLLVSQKYTETCSPFYDIDFLNYCLSIPIEKRYNHKLYKLWIKEKYPEAGNYVWEKTEQKVNSKSQVTIKGKEYSFKQLYKFVLKKTIFRLFKFDNYGLSSKNHMNPIDYWFKTNKDIEVFYKKYFIENIDYLNAYPGLKEDVVQLDKKGSAVERIQILSLLSAAKLIHN